MPGTKVSLVREKMLVFITNYYTEHGKVPTIQQIADHVGRVKATVHYQLKQLERQGLIRYEQRGKYRKYILDTSKTGFRGSQSEDMAFYS